MHRTNRIDIGAQVVREIFLPIDRIAILPLASQQSFFNLSDSKQIERPTKKETRN